ncbi:MAG: DUF1801 domain-containing protein [Candidatus Cybelea sp.]
MKKIVPGDFDDYRRHVPKDAQRALHEVRLAIKKGAPRAQETISYNLPAFALDGKLVVWFGAFKAHVGFYPGAAAIAAFETDLSKYKTARGSAQFPLDRPLPLGLITRIVKFAVRRSAQKSARPVI